MTRLRLFLKNLGSPAQNSLALLSCILLIFGCSHKTTPTYNQGNIEQALESICKKEYSTEAKARLSGSTLWVYIPTEDLLKNAEKPEKYTESFEIRENGIELYKNALRFSYYIKPVPTTEKLQTQQYNKKEYEKITNTFKALRRVIFSFDRSKGDEPHFFFLVAADTKNGHEYICLFYYLDFKKLAYELISWGEFEHRCVQELSMNDKAIGDKTGSHIESRDITMNEFIAWQARHRIRLKFQKPEVKNSVDVDKEIIKIIAYVIKTYGFRDFAAVELNNLLTDSKTTLNEAAIWARANE